MIVEFMGTDFLKLEVYNLKSVREKYKMDYYCLSCKIYVEPVDGTIQHPHMGQIPAKVCPHCGRQAYPGFGKPPPLPKEKPPAK
jgi:hypothetical protein